MSRPSTTPRAPDAVPSSFAPQSPLSRDLLSARREIVACERCPRLRGFCLQIAREKRRAYRDETYWGLPVPGSGDPSARIVVVGLAPAAHGANRTGRNFTGDGNGGSGDFLMTAMHANGLANQPFSRSADDGLVLCDAWLCATARCAPPDNKPTPGEIRNCRVHLEREVGALPEARVFVALGRIAFDACWRLLVERGVKSARRPVFEHGAVYRFPDEPSLIASYHPSRQNTHTGRLTPQMLRDVFRKAVLCAGPQNPVAARARNQTIADTMNRRLGSGRSSGRFR